MKTHVGTTLLIGLCILLEACSSCSEDRSKSEPGITVANPEARSCDVLVGVTEQGKELGARFDATFPDGIQGQSSERFPELAVSFINTKNESFSGSVVSFQLRDGDEDSNQELLHLVEAECFDADGNALAEPGVQLK